MKEDYQKSNWWTSLAMNDKLKVAALRKAQRDQGDLEELQIVVPGQKPANWEEIDMTKKPTIENMNDKEK